MSIATATPDYPGRTARSAVHGVGEVAFSLREGRSGLSHLFQHDPVRILFPQPAATDPPLATVVTTSGGLVSGDIIEIEATVNEGASALVVAQAAEKIYRSTGADSRIDVRLTAKAGGWLEWLPQEAIVFDEARLRRRTLINAAPGATILAGEMLVFGRVASGETFSHGLLRDAWEVRRGDKLVWADALHLEGDVASQLDNPAGFDAARAMATAVVVCDEAANNLETAREIAAQAQGVRASATVVNGVLLIRWLGEDPQRLRRAFDQGWCILRQTIGGYAPRLPRLWHI
jgi:urease accessory protein